MTICTYCGDEVGNNPCRSTRDMEDRISDSHSSKECFAALMILGGGEQSENQRKAAAYQRLVQKQVARP